MLVVAVRFCGGERFVPVAVSVFDTGPVPRALIADTR